MSPASFAPSTSLRERLARLRNFQSQDFWAMVFARPLTILFLLPLADKPWVTPNGITVVSVLFKLAGLAALWLMPQWDGGVIGALLVNLGLVLDNMDGTLARYRNNSSFLGYYLDKTVDIICLAGLFIVVALRVGRETQEIIDVILPLVGFAGASVAAYTKWVAYRVETDIALFQSRQEGKLEAFVAKRLDQNPVIPPPQRTAGDWARWLVKAIVSILQFNEVDIFFFLLLAMVLNEPMLFTRIMCSFYALGLVIGPVHFFFKLRGSLRKAGLK